MPDKAIEALQSTLHHMIRAIETQEEDPSACIPDSSQMKRVFQSAYDLLGELNAPKEMLLWCPACNERHIDVGRFEIHPHHTHACQKCGMVWRPAVFDTVGVRFLPGFKNQE